MDTRKEMKTRLVFNQFLCSSDYALTVGIAAIGLILFALPAVSPAAELKEARVSQVVKDVKLLPAQAAPRPAAVSDEVRDGTAVRTGVDSRAELTFTDQTMARLGANTIFSFREGTRNLELGGGAMLLRVPKDAGGAQINTAAVTAAITGTTVLLEYHSNAFIKFIVLEGTGRMFRKDRPGESVLVHAGQMAIVNPNGKSLADPVNVDLKRLIKTSKLVKGFERLPSEDLINKEVGVQLQQKSEGQLVDTNLVIFGGGTLVSMLDPTNNETISQASQGETVEPQQSPSPSPTPTPVSPTPTPTPISPTPTPTPISPTPTPTPTSPTPSPSPSPSASPTATASPGKYGTPPVITSSIPYEIGSVTVINTDPTITTGGTTDFGTIYRDSATDGPASVWFYGSTSDFDDSIGFDQNIFVGDRAPIAAFKFSALSLIGNPVIVIPEGAPNNLALISVGDMTSGPPGGTLTFSNINFLFLTTQDGSITLTPDVAFQGIPQLGVYARGSDSNLIFDSSVSGTNVLGLLSEGNIQVTDSLTVSQTNVNDLTEGMTISLFAGQGITVGNNLILSTDASGVAEGGSIIVASGGDTNIGGLFGLTVSGVSGNVGNGGSILTNTGGSLTAGSLALLLNYNNRAVSITNGANIDLSVGNDLTTTDGGINALILTPFANSVGNGGNINLSVGGSLSTGEGSVNLRVLTSRGTILGSGANLTTSVGGNLDTGIFTAQIQNSRFGQIETGGNNTFSVGNDLTASSLLFQLDNTGNGDVDVGGNITFTAGNNVTIGGNVDFSVLNSTGHIGTGGNITINTGGDLTASALNATIDNSSGGSIDEGGVITFNTTGTLTTSGETNISINNVGGTNTGAAINLNGGTYDAGGTFQARIDGFGSLAFNNASINADVLKVGALSPNGVLTIGGGTLSADTTLKLYAPGSNGELNFVSNVTLGGNSAKILAAGSVTIFDDVVVTIGGTTPASVYVGSNGETPNANYTGWGGNGSTTGTFAGAGANDPLPLEDAPPFDDTSAASKTANQSSVTLGGRVPSNPTHPGLTANRGRGENVISLRSRPRIGAVGVTDSNELADLIDKATSAPLGSAPTKSKAVTDGKAPGPRSVMPGKATRLSPTRVDASEDTSSRRGGMMSPP